MSDFTTTKIDGNTVGADEWNQLADVDNLISTSGLTPSTSNLNQTAIASARYASAGQFYTDGGTANAYVLSPVSTFKSPVSATAGEGYFVGMTIRFRAGNANTGASTVNVNGAGVKNLKKEDGTTDLASGDITTTRDAIFRYDGTYFIQVKSEIQATTTTQGISYLNSPITIANNATDANNDIDFSAGVMNFTNGSGQALATALTKRLDASWSAGTNQGGLFTGTKANSTWYHCFAIWNPTTSTYDAGFDTSITASNKPSGYTNYEYRGSVLTDGSGNIRAFTQTGRHFTFTPVINSINGASQTAGTGTLRTIASPLGIKTRVRGSLVGTASGSGACYVKAYDADIADATISNNDGYIYVSVGVTDGTGYFEAITNTSSQIKTNAVTRSGGPNLVISITISGYENLALTNF